MTDTNVYPDTYTVANVEEHVGREFGPSVPVTVDQERISSDPARNLSHGPKLEKIFTRFGGHNGFFNSFPASVHSEVLAVDRFKRSLKL